MVVLFKGGVVLYEKIVCKQELRREIGMNE